MDPAWFHAYVQRCRQRSSLPSVEAWISAHDQHAHSASKAAAPATPAAAGAARATHSARNDVRTSASTGGRGIDIGFPPSGSSVNDHNIFANLALHDQAAATIASASQSKSGFTASMPDLDGVAIERFVAYLNDFVAPHWLMTHYQSQTVEHQSSNHNKFVDDLVNIVVDALNAVGGNSQAAAGAAESVRNLAQRLASHTSHEEKLTLFSSFWMERENDTDPVIYGIFYTTLTARYTQNRKTEVISTSTQTYSVLFSLISGVLIANEAAYNRLLKSSVDDWLNGHDV